MSLDDRYRVEFACHTWAFNDLPLTEALGTIARLGFRCVDIGSGPHLDIARVARDPRGVAAEIKRDLDIYNLTLSDLYLMHPRISSPEEDRRRKDIDLFKALLPFIVALETPGVTLSPGLARPAEDEGAFQRTVDALREMVHAAELATPATGLRVSIEPHMDSMAQKPEMARRIVTQVPGLELTLDWAHMVCQDVFHDEIAALLPLTRHVQIRQAARAQLQTPFERGRIDVPRVMRSLRDAGYDGVVSVEYMQTVGWHGTLEVDSVNEVLLMRDALRAARDELEAATYTPPPAPPLAAVPTVVSAEPDVSAMPDVSDTHPDVSAVPADVHEEAEVAIVETDGPALDEGDGIDTLEVDPFEGEEVDPFEGDGVDTVEVDAYEGEDIVLADEDAETIVADAVGAASKVEQETFAVPFDVDDDKPDEDDFDDDDDFDDAEDEAVDPIGLKGLSRPAVPFDVDDDTDGDDLINRIRIRNFGRPAVDDDEGDDFDEDEDDFDDSDDTLRLRGFGTPAADEDDGFEDEDDFDDIDDDDEDIADAPDEAADPFRLRSLGRPGVFDTPNSRGAPVLEADDDDFEDSDADSLRGELEYSDDIDDDYGDIDDGFADDEAYGDDEYDD